MHSSVLEIWHAFSEPLEGRVHSMYVDVKNLVTTGVGNLIDPVGAALRLPWKHPDGSLASDDEIRKQWLTLKHHPGLAVKTGGPLVPLAKLHWKYAAKLTTLRLTDADINALVTAKLIEFESYLVKHHFPFFAKWPADAQLGTLSMAWACGPGFPATFKNFARAATAQDWIAAKATCKIRTEGNPGVVPRNRANEICFENAATVRESGLDPSVLHWPAPAAPLPKAPNGQADARPVLTDADRAQLAAMQDDYAREIAGRIRDDALREISGQGPVDDPEEGGADA